MKIVEPKYKLMLVFQKQKNFWCLKRNSGYQVSKTVIVRITGAISFKSGSKIYATYLYVFSMLCDKVYKYVAWFPHRIIHTCTADNILLQICGIISLHKHRYSALKAWKCVVRQFCRDWMVFYSKSLLYQPIVSWGQAGLK